MAKTKKDLDDILSDITEFTQTEDTLVTDLKDCVKKETQNTLLLIYEKCKSQADSFMTGLVNFYLDGEILSDPYLIQKIDDDKNTLTDLKNQMETSQLAITQLLEVIAEGGAIVPRNFEVLSQLQKAKMEIVKHYEAVKTNIENNYKYLKGVYEQSNPAPMVENAGYGTRALLDDLAINMDEGLLDSPGQDVETTNLSPEDYDIEEEKEEKYELPKGVKFYDELDTNEA